ncbi:hypothetical protein BY458DRAFT_526935, partial [Sporodiniella umbellata]
MIIKSKIFFGFIVFHCFCVFLNFSMFLYFCNVLNCLLFFWCSCSQSVIHYYAYVHKVSSL